MARQRHLHALSLAILIVLALTCLGRAEEQQISEKALTCKVYGGSFVLGEKDFLALTQEKLRSYKVSKERFASLKPNSALRIAICETRKLWRLVKAGKATFDDFAEHYKSLVSNYLTDAERKKVVEAQMDMLAKPRPVLDLSI